MGRVSIFAPQALRMEKLRSVIHSSGLEQLQEELLSIGRGDRFTHISAAKGDRFTHRGGTVSPRITFRSTELSTGWDRVKRILLSGPHMSGPRVLFTGWMFVGESLGGLGG
jgi:hypothetical protein